MKKGFTSIRQSIPALGSSLLLALLLLFVLAGTLLAASNQDERETAVLAPQLAIRKNVDHAQANPGDILAYTIIISNTGTGIANTTFTDTIPTGLTLQPGSLQSQTNNAIELGFGQTNGVITWTGSIGAPGNVTILFNTTITDTTPLGTTITNTGRVTGTGSLLTAHATTLITETGPITYYLYLPISYKAIPVPTLQATTPVNNSWDISWNNIGTGITYRLEEAHDPAFSTNLVIYNLAAGITTKNIQYNPPATGTYYYRVRGEISGRTGGWSNTATVITLPKLTLQSTQPNSSNQWTISWSTAANATSYELEESQTPDFSSGVSTFNMGTGTTKAIQHTISLNNLYYYRVRGYNGSAPGPWSDTLTVIGSYEDSFSANNTGWAMRRTDTGEHLVTYRNNDQLQLELSGTDNYVIVSPMVPAPLIPYRIEIDARIYLPADRHMLGIIFGADWNASTCPVPGYTSCFNTYYELRLQYRSGTTPYIEYKLKRIDGHDSNNEPYGPDLIDWTRVTGAVPDGWNVWAIEVEPDGDIKVFLGSTNIGTVRDTTLPSFIHTYFGVKAETKQNDDVIARFDRVTVKPK